MTPELATFLTTMSLILIFILLASGASVKQLLQITIIIFCIAGTIFLLCGGVYKFWEAVL